MCRVIVASQFDQVAMLGHLVLPPDRLDRMAMDGAGDGAVIFFVDIHQGKIVAEDIALDGARPAPAAIGVRPHGALCPRLADIGR